MEKTSSNKVDTSHWAYTSGYAVGLEKNTTQRDIMSFGLCCAATSVDVYNTRTWLAGFDAGFSKAQEKPPVQRDRNPYGNIPPEGWSAD